MDNEIASVSQINWSCLPVLEFKAKLKSTLFHLHVVQSYSCRMLYVGLI